MAIKSLASIFHQAEIDMKKEVLGVCIQSWARTYDEGEVSGLRAEYMDVLRNTTKLDEGGEREKYKYKVIVQQQFKQAAPIYLSYLIFNCNGMQSNPIQSNGLQHNA